MPIVITDDAQRRSTETHLRRFDEAFANLEAMARPGEPSQLEQLQIEALRAQADDLRRRARSVQPAPVSAHPPPGAALVPRADADAAGQAATTSLDVCNWRSGCGVTEHVTAALSVRARHSTGSATNPGPRRRSLASTSFALLPSKTVPSC